MTDKIYDYVIVDSKLLAYNASYYRQGPVTNFLNIVMNALIFNKIKYKKILWAHDIYKSKYRLDMLPNYKGGRKKNQQKETDIDQSRREAFVAKYKRTPSILKYLGVNINENLQMEADDCTNLIHEMEPEANILAISLDMDWLFGAIDNDKIDILRYDKNTLINSANINEYTLGKYFLEANELQKVCNIIQQTKDSIGTGMPIPYPCA